MSIESISGATSGPYLDKWFKQLATQPSDDGITFQVVRPLRQLNTFGFLLGIGCFLVFAYETWKTHFKMPWNDYVCLIIGILAVLSIFRWPPKILAKDNGLCFSSVGRNRLILWDQIEFVVTDMDNVIVIYLKGGNEIRVSPFTQGNQQLIKLIEAKLKMSGQQ